MHSEPLYVSRRFVEKLNYRMWCFFFIAIFGYHLSKALWKPCNSSGSVSNVSLIPRQFLLRALTRGPGPWLEQHRHKNGERKGRGRRSEGNGIVQDHKIPSAQGWMACFFSLKRAALCPISAFANFVQQSQLGEKKNYRQTTQVIALTFAVTSFG